MNFIRVNTMDGIRLINLDNVVAIEKRENHVFISYANGNWDIIAIEFDDILLTIDSLQEKGVRWVNT